jgi:hypothetical protein
VKWEKSNPARPRKKEGLDASASIIDGSLYARRLGPYIGNAAVCPFACG